jgi:hypothetical protein
MHIGALGEEMLRALTAESRDRLKTRREESTRTRTLLRVTIYCLKIVVVWAYE